MDIYILPVLCLMNLCAYLDKANIGNANTAGMSADLGLTTWQYQFLLTIFYVVYTCFQWEFVLLKYIQPRFFLGIIVTLWGLASCLQGVTKGFGGMVACRVVIALLEAGGGPAVAFYFSLLYPLRDFGLRYTIFMCTSCLANSFAGAMAYGLVQAKTALAPWRLVFLVESVPTFLSAILLLVLLPSAPDKCIFLSKRENEIAKERLIRGSVSDHKTGYRVKPFFRSFLDLWTWWISIMHFFGGCAFASLSVFLTAIIRDMGYTSINSQGLSAAAWLAAWVGAVTCGYFSDRLSIRGWFIAAAHLVGGIGYMVIAFAESTGVRYFAVYLTVIGVYVAEPIMFSWVSNNGETDSKRAASLVLFLVAGQCSSIMGSNIYNDPPRYIKGNSICAAGLFCNVFLAAGAVLYLRRRNKQKDEKFGPVGNHGVITAMEDGSPHPAWRFVY